MIQTRNCILSSFFVGRNEGCDWFFPIAAGNFVMNTQYKLQNLLIDRQKCLGCRLLWEWGQGMAKRRYVPVEHEVIGLQNAFVLPLTCNYWLVYSDQNLPQADTQTTKNAFSLQVNETAFSSSYARFHIEMHLKTKVSN